MERDMLAVRRPARVLFMQVGRLGEPPQRISFDFLHPDVIGLRLARPTRIHDEVAIRREAWRALRTWKRRHCQEAERWWLGWYGPPGQSEPGNGTEHDARRTREQEAPPPLHCVGLL